MRRRSTRGGIQNLPILKTRRAGRASREGREQRERADRAWATEIEGGVGKIARKLWTLHGDLLGTMSQGRALVVGTRLASRTRPPVDRIARTVYSGGSEWGVEQRNRYCCTAVDKDRRRVRIPNLS